MLYTLLLLNLEILTEVILKWSQAVVVFISLFSLSRARKLELVEEVGPEESVSLCLCVT